MNSKLKHIIKFEFLCTVKTKGFIIGIFLTPLLFIGMIALMTMFAEKSNDHTQEEISVGICTESKDSILAEIVQRINEMKWRVVESPDKELLRNMTFERKIKGFIEYDSAAGYNFFSDNYTDLYVSNTIGGIVSSTNQRLEIMRSGLSPEQLDKILHPASINTFKLSEENPDNSEASNVKTEVFARQICGYILAFLIMLSVMMFGQSIGMSVLQDKSTKIVDVLLTSVKPTQLLLGKILGVGSAGMLQFLVWLTIAVVSTSYTDTLPFEGMSEFLTPRLYILATVFFLFGFAMVVCIYAALGSMAETQQHFTQLVSGISFFVAAPMIVATPVAMNADSTFSVVMSMIPIFSSSLMPVRIIAGDVPAWQVALSLIILIGACFLVVKAAAQIYRNAIMQQGKEFKLKDILKLVHKQ